MAACVRIVRVFVLGCICVLKTGEALETGGSNFSSVIKEV
jgi:hypothetical protein